MLLKVNFEFLNKKSPFNDGTEKKVFPNTNYGNFSLYISLSCTLLSSISSVPLFFFSPAGVKHVGEKETGGENGDSTKSEERARESGKSKQKYSRGREETEKWIVWGGREGGGCEWKD